MCKIRLLIVVLFFTLLLSVFCGCNYNGNAPKGKAYTKEQQNFPQKLNNIRNAAKKANPNGKEYYIDEEDIYIMLPDKNWREISCEKGCVGFSQNEEYIYLYYGNDDGVNYKNAPRTADDMSKIITKSGFNKNQFEVIEFNFSEINEIITYSHVIKFNLSVSTNTPHSFYAVVKTICTKNMLYSAAGCIYNKNNIPACQLAEESFTVP